MDNSFHKRMLDLAEQAYRKGLYTYSAFLNEGEISDVLQMEREIDAVGFTLFGGREHSIRQIVRFGSAEQMGYEEAWPIRCIRTDPVNARFAEELTHRDYLGALMHLGMEREMVGDILIRGKTAYLFCLEKMADYIVSNLTQVRHTCVKPVLTEELPEEVSPVMEEVSVLVSGERLDALIAHLTNLSRSETVELFRQKMIFVNGRCCENNSGVPKAGDIISVRGHGKFRYMGPERETKKGKLRVRVAWYR